MQRGGFGLICATLLITCGGPSGGLDDELTTDTSGAHTSGITNASGTATDSSSGSADTSEGSSSGTGSSTVDGTAGSSTNDSSTNDSSTNDSSTNDSSTNDSSSTAYVSSGSTTDTASSVGGSSGGSSDDGASIVDVVIDFDAYAEGTVIDDEYAEYAIFSTENGYVNVTSDNLLIGQSRPNYLCTGDPGLTCTADTYVDFTHPVSALSLRCLGTETSGLAATIRVYAEDELLDAIAVQGSGATDIPIEIDLGEFEGVTRIELVDIVDTYGVAWDDFAFSTSVP
jgi:hypothetical protein